MANVYRIFVEKKKGNDIEAMQILTDLRQNVGITALTGLRLINRYDVQGVSEAEFRRAVHGVFAEDNLDNTADEVTFAPGERVFAMEFLPGQYDQRADSAAQCIQLLTAGECPRVASAKVIALAGDITDAEFDKIKSYLINPVESREASLDLPETLRMEYTVPTSVRTITGFTAMDAAGLDALREDLGLAMDLDDLKFLQAYFRDEERRDPTITEIRVVDTATGTLTEDRIEWVKNSGATWSPDSKGFYYSAYDAPEKSVYSDQNQFQKVYYHELGTPQSSDRLVYEDKNHPLRYFWAWPSEDGKWLFVCASEGTSGTEVLYRKTSEKNFRTLLPGFDADYGVVTVENDRLYYVTNRDASNYTLRRIDLNRPAKDEVVIPENAKNLLEGVGTAGGYLFAAYLQDAQSRIAQYDFEGKLVREVALPAIGSVSGFGGEKEDKEIYYSLTNYTAPATIYRYDIATGESTLYKAPEVRFDPSLFTTEQVFYPSKDGTQVPMFITRRKDMKLEGKNPCLLYGYGGFQINMTPGFSPAALMFVEQGGIYCVANLRGGSEYGESWHRGGMLENKQNVFDDFIAAAEYLIANKYTSSDKLAINGGSNGGLLVGACEVQRPDLYAVCLPQVGVLDMLRYHKFTIGWGWAVEYGSSENEEQFGYIYKYSPLHNIREGVKYPATLVMTADHDDRVVPAHSFKFAAQLQHCQAGEAPVLIRIESKAGHGAGKPTSKRIDEAADMYAFLFQNIGVPYRPVGK